MFEPKDVRSVSSPDSCSFWAQHVVEPKYVGSGSSSDPHLIGLITWLKLRILDLTTHQTHIPLDSARGWPKDVRSDSLPIPCLFGLNIWLNPSMLGQEISKPVSSRLGILPSIRMLAWTQASLTCQWVTSLLMDLFKQGLRLFYNA